MIDQNKVLAVKKLVSSIAKATRQERGLRGNELNKVSNQLNLLYTEFEAFEDDYVRIAKWNLYREQLKSPYYRLSPREKLKNLKRRYLETFNQVIEIDQPGSFYLTKLTADLDSTLVYPDVFDDYFLKIQRRFGFVKDGRGDLIKQKYGSEIFIVVELPIFTSFSRYNPRKIIVERERARTEYTDDIDSSPEVDNFLDLDHLNTVDTGFWYYAALTVEGEVVSTEFDPRGDIDEDISDYLEIYNHDLNPTC